MTSLQPLTLTYIFSVRRYMVLAVGIGVVAILATVLITLPQVKATFDANNQRVQVNQKLVKLQRKVSQLQTATDPQFQSQTDLVNALLPSKKPLVETLSGINSAMVASEVQVKAVELSPGEVATDSAELEPDVNVTGPSTDLLVYLTIEGSLEQLNRFFEAIERTTPLITITELTLSPLEGDGLLGGSQTVPVQPYSAKLTLAASYFIQNVSTTAEEELPTVSLDQQKIIDELASFTVIAPTVQPQVVGGGLEDLFGLEQPAIIVKE